MAKNKNQKFADTIVAMDPKLKPNPAPIFSPEKTDGRIIPDGVVAKTIPVVAPMQQAADPEAVRVYTAAALSGIVSRFGYPIGDHLIKHAMIIGLRAAELELR